MNKFKKQMRKRKTLLSTVGLLTTICMLSGCASQKQTQTGVDATENAVTENPKQLSMSDIFFFHDFYEEFGTDEFYTLQNTYEANLNHSVDGSGETEPDKIEVYTGNVGDGDSGMVLVYSGYPANDVFSIEAHTSRAGWTNIYLVTIDEKDYIFQLNFDARDVFGYGTFYVYSFEEQAGTTLAVNLLEGWEFDFDGEIDLDAYHIWAEKMNAYLKDAELLLSTQDGEVRVGPGNDFERYNEEKLLMKMEITQ